MHTTGAPLISAPALASPQGASPQGHTAISPDGTPIVAALGAIMQPLAASQGYPWDEAVRDGLELMVPNQICARVSVKRMNDLMKESRDMMFSHELFPQRLLLGAPFRCISFIDG